MTAVVLDSSAILAVINNEAGSDAVVNLLDDALLSAVNHAEVMGKLVERGLSRQEARSSVIRMGIQIVAFGADLAERAGELRAQTRNLGLSLGDRACLALAEREKRIAVTADRKWQSVKADIPVHLIR